MIEVHDGADDGKLCDTDQFYYTFTFSFAEDVIRGGCARAIRQSIVTSTGHW